ncbi:MAG: membrane protein insertase YidC, partial [Gammaproteobacteria bacterium]
AWQKDYPSAPPAPTQQPAEQMQPASTPNTTTETLPAVPPAPTAMISSVTEAIPANRIIHVNTDVLRVEIDIQGGQIIGASLLEYPAKAKEPNKPFVLLNHAPNTLYTAESGLVGNMGPDTQKNQAIYKTAKPEYRLEPGKDSLTVPLEWTNPDGLKVTKTFTFKRSEYLIRVGYQLENHTAKPWTGYLYTQLKRKEVAQETSMFQINPYVGAVISSPAKRYEKVSFDDMKKSPLNREIQEGWVAFVQHYFLSAWVPEGDQPYQYTTQVLPDNVFLVRQIGPALNIAPGQSARTEAKLYAGPDIVENLKPIAPGMDLLVDYGVLWVIGTALFWLMEQLYKFLGNWGWAIVFVTLIVKVLFYKLSATSYRSMAAMRELQPRLMLLKERYGDDRQKMSQATMELYKKEKINPLGGCLPILVQIPVFIALYWVLLESVQLRQAPFILWIHDLSAQDPYYILPILMGLTMLIQQKLNPAPVDPVQAKVMMFLPFVFTLLFLSFPAGLVLYWVVNNALSILQQWYITKTFEKKPKKA